MRKVTNRGLNDSENAILSQRTIASHDAPLNEKLDVGLHRQRRRRTHGAGKALVNFGHDLPDGGRASTQCREDGLLAALRDPGVMADAEMQRVTALPVGVSRRG